ncbi:MAG: SLC13 family permease [Gemmatimonadales bacterium]|nr:SLC13 family permease [Gemmatimonadales bacterium]MDZ4390170.1 SLC13 family permease [Gemmatimonadales bacterium]
MHETTALLTSTTDPLSQWLVAGTLFLLFVLLTMEKAHRVLVALGAVSILWAVTYLTPYHLISFEQAARALDLNVLLLLASMMAVVGVLKATGVFGWAVSQLLRRSGNHPLRVMVAVIWFAGVSSAFLDNVTTVIFLAPIILGVAAQLEVSPRALLLPMIMAANIGGTATLIGDPPNIMIGSAAGLAFADFLVHLTAPVLVMLLALQLVASRWFRSELAGTGEPTPEHGDGAPRIVDPALLHGMGWICGFILIGFLTHGMTGMPAAVPATIGAAAALVLQDVLYLRRHDAEVEERSHGILRVLEHEIEWPTLVFFAFLFIVVGAAVETGLITTLASTLADAITGGQERFGLGPEATLLFAALLVLWAAGILSGLIDNIPFVAVAIPILAGLIPTLPGDGQVLWWALALGACLGGNSTPIGASANVTTLDLAARGKVHISFREYVRFAIPITAMTLIVASAYLAADIYLGYWPALGITSAVAGLLFGLTRIRRRQGGGTFPRIAALPQDLPQN